MNVVLFCAVVVYVPMLVEAARASANEQIQRARGGIEPPDDVYQAMRIIYPGVFLAMIAEGYARNGSQPYVFAFGIVVFVLAKALKWWAIATLGRAWTFRVIVVPGDPLVANGPYRRIRHPNYAAVLGELVGAALIAGAPVAGTLGTGAFAVLLRKRISVEDQMLGRLKAES